nr:MAG TPA: hypothetical protein [Caudoviricetes sp.]
MTVKEVAKAITGVENFYIAWDGAMQNFIPDDEIMLKAYGGFVVKTIDFVIESGSKGHVEIVIATRPVVEGEAAE